ncbi:hypothetical protein LTR10_009366 [Elasticomyces elasticus]|uniref:Uncharacterized protein n=1 Tax=Elasticomyces elasticus TaxID=574655 RepID=A0AAN7W700_9PEZI|nr:hypothetical protein LTR10_009366 [Elasticomyces elasticus]KAK4971535.1 hypothetical protein LTR42_007263 [Elasticomyces elasticus]KAK5695304.1 hypothetical protein LTR97_008810 [Elasticomyces elasticus]KAK5714200.1 hypothetical protein LTR15_011108 [Elasticomyces elasticus]
MFQAEYALAPTESADEQLDDTRAVGTLTKSWWKRATAYASTAIWVFVGLAMLSVLLVTQTMSNKRSFRAQSCACGSSAAEAIVNGCKFDPFGMVWLPDRCRDDELIGIFTDYGEKQHHNWTFFTYPHITSELTIGEVASLAGDPYIDAGKIVTTLDWHHAHCLYVLLNYFRSDATHLGIAERYRSQEHGQHCAKALMQLVASNPRGSNPRGMSEVDTYAE